MERKEKRKTDEIDFLGILNKVWNGRRLILGNMLLGLILGFLISISLPKKYRSQVKIVPEDSKEIKNNRINTLASLMGLNTDGMVNTDVSPDLYPVIIESVPYLIDLAGLEVTPEGKDKMSLYEYLVLHQKKSWWHYIVELPQTIVDLFSQEKHIVLDSVWDIYKLTSVQKAYVNSMVNNIFVETEKGTGVITVRVEMEDPRVVAVVANTMVSKLRDYIINYREQKVRDEVNIVERMFMEAKSSYENTQERINNYRGNNDKNLLGKQMDADLSFSLYNMLAQQYEMSKLKVLEKLPVFSVIEPAMEPLTPSSPHKVLIMVITLLLGMLGSAVWLLIRDAF